MGSFSHRSYVIWCMLAGGGYLGILSAFQCHLLIAKHHCNSCCTLRITLIACVYSTYMVWGHYRQSFPMCQSCLHSAYVHVCGQEFRSLTSAVVYWLPRSHTVCTHGMKSYPFPAHSLPYGNILLRNPCSKQNLAHDVLQTESRSWCAWTIILILCRWQWVCKIT